MRSPQVDLQDGQYVFEKVAPGTHTVSVTGPNAEASFTFDLAPARLHSRERNCEHEKYSGDAGGELRRTRPPGDQLPVPGSWLSTGSLRTTPVRSAWT